MDTDDFDDDEDFGLGEATVQESGGQPEEEAAPSELQSNGAAAGAPLTAEAAPVSIGGAAQAPAADGEADDLYGDVLGGGVDVHERLDGVNGSAGPPVSATPASQPQPAQTQAGPAHQPAVPSVPTPSAGSQPQEGGSAVFIGNLQWWTTDADLENACLEFGAVAEVHFTEEKANGRSKGYARVHFAEAEAAEGCKAALNGRDINGKAAIVTLAGTIPSTSVTSSGLAGQPGARPPFAAGRGGPLQGGFHSGRGPRPPVMFRPGGIPGGGGPMGGMGAMQRPGMGMGGMPGRGMMPGVMGGRGGMPFMNGRGMAMGGPMGPGGGMGGPMGPGGGMGMPAPFALTGGQLSGGMPGGNMPPTQVDYKRRRL